MTYIYINIQYHHKEDKTLSNKLPEDSCITTKILNPEYIILNKKNGPNTIEKLTKNLEQTFDRKENS